MSQVCTVCAHEDAVLINEDIVGIGERGRPSKRSIAARYGLSEQALARHKGHIPQLLVKAAEAEEIAHADDLVHEIKTMVGRVRAFIDKAEAASDGPEFRAHAAEWRKQVELLAKIAGELQVEGTSTTNVALIHHPDYARLSDAILGALVPYEDARYAVAEALREIE